MIKQILRVSVLFLVGFLLISCTTQSPPQNKKEQCDGLYRRITHNTNNNSYDTDLLKSRRSDLEHRYKALGCGDIKPLTY
jgi:hypothetical protein